MTDMPKAPVKRALSCSDIEHISDSAVDELHSWLEEVLIKLSFLIARRAERNKHIVIGKDDVNEVLKEVNYSGDDAYKRIKEVLK